MNKVKYAVTLLVALSFVFAAQVEAKHAAEKTRARVLSQISK